MPKTAITASPMNFSTVPPCCSMSAFIAPKYRVMSARVASGSWRSPSCVDPATSANSTETVLRTSRGRASTGASRAPQRRRT